MDGCDALKGIKMYHERQCCSTRHHKSVLWCFLGGEGFGHETSFVEHFVPASNKQVSKENSRDIEVWNYSS